MAKYVDQRRMCLYHEEHPTTKQTEIGALFGVERSTVSKVLGRKEKYLGGDEGGRSPIKRLKGSPPDIERALSIWVRNKQKEGVFLSDEEIRDKALFFAASVSNVNSLSQANNAVWLEKFKQKNNIDGSKTRKKPLAAESRSSKSYIVILHSRFCVEFKSLLDVSPGLLNTEKQQHAAPEKPDFSSAKH
ncbi:hypothetical protein B0A49_05723 [Cryomyces minteri]|uniref:HTH CENPB-type domain-containing protein n=1 Tax=Cryomyces minteri TaxID=331657 RepID=A0A4U0XYI8_9PEZI|nr:hypothetical protein B0A49_05723 [Cryomyces minteri]